MQPPPAVDAEAGISRRLPRQVERLAKDRSVTEKAGPRLGPRLEPVERRLVAAHPPEGARSQRLPSVGQGRIPPVQLSAADPEHDDFGPEFGNDVAARPDVEGPQRLAPEGGVVSG